MNDKLNQLDMFKTGDQVQLSESALKLRRYHQPLRIGTITGKTKNRSNWRPLYKVLWDGTKTEQYYAPENLKLITDPDIKQLNEVENIERTAAITNVDDIDYSRMIGLGYRLNKQNWTRTFTITRISIRYIYHVDQNNRPGRVVKDTFAEMIKNGDIIWIF